MKYTKIELLAARTQEDVEGHQCVVVEDYDTVSEAKRRAKYVLSKDYAVSAELSAPLGYARVVADGQCLYDYFGKA